MRRADVISRAFCSGEIRAKMVWFCAASSNPASPSVSISTPVIAPFETKPSSAQTFSATSGLSPVATLTSMPSAANCARESRAAALGSSANTKKPSSASPDSSAAVMAVRSGAGLLATATTRRPAANNASSVRCAACGTAAQLASTLLGCALDHQQRGRRRYRAAPRSRGAHGRTVVLAARRTLPVTPREQRATPTMRHPSRWR